jgi:acyl-CoA thioester hydrolase
VTTQPKSSSEFRLRITAQKADIDELGHVSNLVYVRWILDVAVAHSSAVGWTPEAYLAAGKVFVVRRHEIDYLSSALEGDEIDLFTWIEDHGAASSTRRTKMIRVKDGRELARGTTLWAFISTTNGRPQRIPPEVVNAFIPRV